jgi:hypothetical protein
MIQSSPSRFAYVSMLATSEPAPGSVIPRQAIFSPRTAVVRYRSFCSGVPNRSMGGVAISLWTAMAMPTPAEPIRAISSAMTMEWPQSPPCPPTSTG